MKTNYWNILKDSAKIAEERQEQYGDIKENCDNISAILETAFKLSLSSKQIAEVMIATKLARNLHKESDDNTADLINYIAIRKQLI